MSYKFDQLNPIRFEGFLIIHYHIDLADFRLLENPSLGYFFRFTYVWYTNEFILTVLLYKHACYLSAPAQAHDCYLYVYGQLIIHKGCKFGTFEEPDFALEIVNREKLVQSFTPLNPTQPMETQMSNRA